MRREFDVRAFIVPFQRATDERPIRLLGQANRVRQRRELRNEPSCKRPGTPDDPVCRIRG